VCRWESGLTLRDSVRRSLHEFFTDRHADDDPLYKALRWILFRGWTSDGVKFWELPNCPNYGCDRGVVRLTPASADEETCDVCGKPIYLVDACRLHERIDEEQGAAGFRLEKPSGSARKTTGATRRAWVTG
jgi:hypothetical protein